MTSDRHVRSHVTEVLEVLGHGLGIDLTLDQDDSCFFEHKDGWHMAIVLPNDEQIVASVSVLSSVEAPDEHIWPVLVEYGWMGAQTDGAALSWNPESRSFVLWYARDAISITPEELNTLMLKLCRAVAAVRPALSDSIFGQGEGADEAEARLGPSDMMARRV